MRRLEGFVLAAFLLVLPLGGYAVYRVGRYHWLNRQMATAVGADVPRIRELLREGANPNLQNWEGCTALNFAVCEGELSFVKELLSKGADVNLPNTLNGGTPLMFASGAQPPTTEAASEEMVGLLLSRGARVNAQDNEGHTALEYALVWKRRGVIRMLLAHGADAFIRNGSGNNAFTQSEGDPEMKKLLEPGDTPRQQPTPPMRKGD